MPRKNPIPKSWEIQDLIPNFPIAIIDKLMFAYVCCVSPALLLLPGFHAMAHPWLPWLRSCVPHMDKGIIEGGVDVSNASIAAISTRSPPVSSNVAAKSSEVHNWEIQRTGGFPINYCV